MCIRACATCLQTDKEIHLNKQRRWVSIRENRENTSHLYFHLLLFSFRSISTKYFLVIANQVYEFDLAVCRANQSVSQAASHCLRYLSYSAEINLSLSACIFVLILFRPRTSFVFLFSSFFSLYSLFLYYKNCMPSLIRVEFFD